MSVIVFFFERDTSQHIIETMSKFTLYFGVPTDEEEKVANAVMAKGLFLMKSAPDKNTVTVICEHTSTRYLFYVGNITASMFANDTGSSVITDSRNCFKLMNESILPIQKPNVSLTVTNMSSQLENHLSQHGTVVRIHNKDVWILDRFSIQDIRDLCNDERINQKSVSSNNSVNIVSLRTGLVLEKIIVSFLCTHRYPSYTNDITKKRSAAALEEKGTEDENTSVFSDPSEYQDGVKRSLLVSGYDILLYTSIEYTSKGDQKYVQS